jgi:hypothetical protein
VISGRHNAIADLRPTIPVATAIHGRDPAEPIWTLGGTAGQRLPLQQLPSSHGPEGISNPQRFEQ